MSSVSEFVSLDGDKVREFVCLYLTKSHEEAEDFCTKHFADVIEKITGNNNFDKIARALISLLSIDAFEKHYTLEIHGSQLLYHKYITYTDHISYKI